MGKVIPPVCKYDPHKPLFKKMYAWLCEAEALFIISAGSLKL